MLNLEPDKPDTDTVTRFERWLEAARPGGRTVYYTGELGVARGTFPRREGGDLLEARAAWEAAQTGLVHLVQKRRHGYTFDYIAVRARPKREFRQNRGQI